jgi:TetR/AcrR family transcriptional regulator, fatty acid metabolism regulator protein
MGIIDKKIVDRRILDPKTLEKLRATILELFANASFQDVGVRQICEMASVSPKTVYKYFGNKDEMLFGCIQADLDGMNAACVDAVGQHSDYVEKMGAFLDQWCGFYFDHPEIARIVFLNIPQRAWAGDRYFVQVELQEAGHNLIREGQAAGAIGHDLDPKLTMDILMGGAHRAMIHWLVSDDISGAQVLANLKLTYQRLLFVDGSQ